MSILTWNCQGLGTPLTVQALRAISAQERPNFIFPWETKNKKRVVSRVRKSLKFQNQVVVDPSGIGGGLALLWKDEVKVEILTTSSNLFDLRYEDPTQGKPFPLSCVYAPATYHERGRIWDQIKHIKPASNLPWVWIGDFNETLYT